MTAIASPVSARTRFGDWIGAILVALLWSFLLVGWVNDVQSFAWFLLTMGIYVLTMLLFLGWWLTRRSFTWGQRFLVVGCAVLLPVLVAVVSHRTIQQPIQLVFLGVPFLLAVWAAWILATTRRPARVRVGGLIGCFVLVWGAFLLLRINGLQGNLRADLHWRWTPTPEELYLAQHPAGSTGPTTLPATGHLELRPGDWPAFRGPRRDGVARDSQIALDWSKSPPKVLWRQRLGPAWSSMIIVDGRVFTQEQRDQQESVVCRDATSGQEIWVHTDPARFDEAMSGPGPRATPAFANGKIFAQGALGILNCLDAADGHVVWSRDVRQDAAAAVPMWGFSGSPLVVDDRLIVFAGGEGKKGLLAYPLAGGQPLWTCDAGNMSYASPQEFTLGSQRQVLMFTSEALFAVDPSNGQTRWQMPIKRAVGLPSSLQPCQVAPDSIVLGNGAAFGTQRLRVAGNTQSANQEWVTQRMKPGFSDMVYHDGFIYGFDGTVFCCIDAASGGRKWRDGHYGAGQVILFEPQGVMIVSSEDGQAILLRCNPDHHEELGRVQAVSGKAWNHPAFAQGRLYVRSDGEMACLQLTPSGSQ